ncbi:hypothetical protein AWV79_32150 [Cupriavidus sp. UYMMa02A]|nr:hypothetical protein AWV80_33310 [Cupriavidus sp. UYMU48A]ODV41879.1 hypothetical protein AWV79_32150 [Cupriavidus sp. UYMMa02A]
MARYFQFVARAFSVGAIIVIVAIVSRQVYLRSASEAGIAGAVEKMLIQCEAMHRRLQNQHISDKATDEEETPLARCIGS